MIHEVIQGDCEKELDSLKNLDFHNGIHLTFLDPPFNQDKEYNHHNDSMPEKDYWNWMKRITKKIYDTTVEGGAIYFMQREKNADFVLETLKKTGWTYQNLIIWQKLAGGVPSNFRYGKKYQIIAFFTKGKKPITFNNLRYEPPLLAMHKYERETGMYLTDIWEDIRELTSGYFAGEEAIRIKDNVVFASEGDRFHKQQSPIKLLTRIVLTSSKINDFVLDPFSGTGVTAVVAKQLERNSISIELDPVNIDVINKRLEMMREADRIDKFYSDYIYTKNFDSIWQGNESKEDTEENYNFKEIKKIKLNDTFIMKETIMQLLVEEIRIPRNIIDLNYRMKDLNDNIHRFELVIHVKPKENIIFRLIYAKNNSQANYWANAIWEEKEAIEKKEPNSKFFVILCGNSFKNYIENLKNTEIKNILLAFPGWENTYDLLNLSTNIKSLGLDKISKTKKQITIDKF